MTEQDERQNKSVAEEHEAMDRNPEGREVDEQELIRRAEEAGQRHQDAPSGGSEDVRPKR